MVTHFLELPELKQRAAQILAALALAVTPMVRREALE
jgi:hypothetical protein